MSSSELTIHLVHATCTMPCTIPAINICTWHWTSFYWWRLPRGSCGRSQWNTMNAQTMCIAFDKTFVWMHTAQLHASKLVVTRTHIIHYHMPLSDQRDSGTVSWLAAVISRSVAGSDQRASSGWWQGQVSRLVTWPWNFWKCSSRYLSKNMWVRPRRPQDRSRKQD